MATASDDFLFVAYDPHAKSHALLEIKPHDAQAHAYLKDVCHKMAQAVRGFHDLLSSDPCPGWAVWKIVEWSQKTTDGQSRFCAWAGDVLAGYIWLREGFVSPHDSATICYVDLMAATPTNLQTAIWNRRLSHIGVALLAFGVQHSLKTGFCGRFGLHAADDEAAEWYRRLGRDHSTLFLPEMTGVRGAPPLETRGITKPYFEATARGAIELLESFRNA